MPKIIIPTSDVYESVTRPVVLDMIRQIVDITNLPQDTIISFPGDLEKVQQPGSSITKDSDTVTFPFSQRIWVDVEENYESDRLLSTAIYRPENLFIFRDDKLETLIKPAYSSTDITINFRYRAVDKVQATKWRDDIRMRLSMNRDIRVHEISYHYLVPEEFLVILKEIHRMREAVDGYGEDYDTYFKNNSSQRVSLLANLNGSKTAFGVAETQKRIVGWFDFDGVPELGSREDEGDTWSISFSYKFRFDKPIACVMFYPLMIHNQLVDQRYRSDTLPYEIEDTLTSHAMSAKDFSYFERDTIISDNPPGIAIPAFDEFIPASIVTNTFRVITALVSIDTETPTFLLSLRDLGDYTIHPAILDFLVEEIPYMTKPGLSVFNLSLYKGIDLLPPELLRVDADLCVHTTQQLSLREYYHVRLSLHTDLSALPKTAIDRLRNFGEAAQLILGTIDASLVDKNLMPNILGNDYITRADMELALNEIDRINLLSGNGQIYQINTVERLMIQAHKKQF